MGLDRHYTDPRLAALYDGDNPGTDDHDFYLALAAELGSTAVLDLGCGTGVLGVLCAGAGLAVTGVEPAAAMLAVARERPGGEAVTWIEGFADAIPTACADLAVMSGHTAQVFVADDAWANALGHLHRGLRRGGRLAFETRNPATDTWRSMTKESSFANGTMADGEPFHTWAEVTEVTAGTVSFLGHNVLSSTGEDLVATSTLRFRTVAELSRSLAVAGFATERWFGFWDRRPLTPASPEIIVVARRVDVAE